MSERLLSRPSRNKKINSESVRNEAPATAAINVDYPREEELINTGHYAIRISGLPEAQVELSINNGEWQGCRTALDFYWFDWQPSVASEYVLVARQRVGKGRWQKSDQRFCRVISANKKN